MIAMTACIWTTKQCLVFKVFEEVVDMKMTMVTLRKSLDFKAASGLAALGHWQDKEVLVCGIQQVEL
jgi:hypothetical protein